MPALFLPVLKVSRFHMENVWVFVCFSVINFHFSVLKFNVIDWKSWKPENISAFAGRWNIWNSGGALSHICTKGVPGATIANNLALLLHTITCRNTIEYFERLRLFSLSKLHGFAQSYCTLTKHFNEHSSNSVSFSAVLGELWIFDLFSKLHGFAPPHLSMEPVFLGLLGTYSTC